MFWRQSSDRFEFHYQIALNNKVSNVVADCGAVFIPNLYRKLLVNTKPAFLEPATKRIFIDLLEVTVTKVEVDSIGCLANDIAMCSYLFRV